MRRGLALFLALLPALAAPGTGYALFVGEDGVWVGGELRGRPLLVHGERRWLGEAPGWIRAILRGLWAGSLKGDAALVRFGPDGKPLKIARFGGPLNEEAVALAESGGVLYLAGNAEGAPFGKNRGGQDVFLLALDQGRWAPRFALQWGSGNDDVLTALAPAPDGGVYLAGYEEVNEDCIRVAERGFVLRVGPDGGVRWVYRFGFEASSRPTALLATGEGVWVAGNTDGPLLARAKGGDDVFVLLLTSSGAPKVRAQWGSARSDLSAKLLAQGGRLWLYGETAGALFGEGGRFAPFLARLDARGRPEWGRKIPAGTEAHAADAAFGQEKLWLLFNTPGGFGLKALAWPLR